MSWAALVERMTLKFPIPMEIRVCESRDGQVRLEACIDCPDVNDGKPLRVFVSDYPPPWDDVKDKEPERYLRNFLLRLLAHELDESIFVDNEKLHDPHSQKTYIPKYI